MALDQKIIDTLSQVTTATLTTLLLKKGLRNVWMRGTRPLNPGQPRLVGPAFTLRFVPAREDLATPESWSKPISTRGGHRGDARGLHRGRRRHGRDRRRHLRRHPVRAHEEEGRRGARHRRRAARRGRRARHGASRVVPGRGGPAVGRRPHLRELGRAHRLRRRGGVPRRRGRRGRRRRGAHPAGPGRRRWCATAPEQERLEGWIMSEVEKGASLPGLYPPNAENKARYEATKGKA